MFLAVEIMKIFILILVSGVEQNIKIYVVGWC